MCSPLCVSQSPGWGLNGLEGYGDYKKDQQIELSDEERTTTTTAIEMHF